MDLKDAIQSHMQWKTKFRSAISKQEKLDAATIAKDNACQLGQWLYGEGKPKWGNLAEFQKLLDQHKAFHVEAGKVAHLINAKQYVEAEQALGNGTAYTNASSAVGTAVISLRKAAGL